MPENLPAGRLELIYVEGFDLNDFSDDLPKGFIVEFDTEYSKNYRVLAIIFVAKKYVAWLLQADYEHIQYLGWSG